MTDMKFYLPTAVYDEKECVAAHAAELAALGSKALIVTGRHSAARCGALDDVLRALRDHGTGHCIFSEVEENPSVETVVRAAAFGKAQAVDFVIGIGGGSAIDAAKATAFLLAKDDPAKAPSKRDVTQDVMPWAEALYNAELPTAALPVAAVPTTCGTGSEVTGVSVLTRHDIRTKGSIPHKIFPAIALVDGKYLRTAPHSMIVNTAVDALAHMIESCEMTNASDYSRAVAVSGLQIWKRSKDILSGDREPSDDDLANLMRASTFAGIAIAQTGTSIPHALSYILTYDLGIPHGKACGYYLPEFLREADAEDQRILLDAAGFESVHAFTQYLRTVLPDDSVPQATRQRAYDVVIGNTARLQSCRFNVNEKVLRRIARL